MRIFHVANFSWINSKRKGANNLARYYALDHKISNGLTRNGHVVWQFSYRDHARHLSPLKMGKKLGAGKMNQLLIEEVRQFQPQLLLLGHAEIVTAATLAAIRDMLPDCKIAQWWVDPFSDFSVQHLREKMPYLNAFFATTAPSYVRKRITSVTLPPIYYLPNITDATVEDQRAFAADHYDFDLLFIGASVPERAALLEQLAQSAHYRCGFYGFGGRQKLSGREFIATFGKSKMGLNLSRFTDIPLYSSDRIAQITGNGCLALTPRTPQMDILFNADEIVYYDNDEHCIALVEQYSKDDNARRRIAKAGWQRAHSSYNEQRITRFMGEAATTGEFSEQYEWLTVG